MALPPPEKVNSAMNGKSSGMTDGQRGRATGWKRAHGGGREVRPGARGMWKPPGWSPSSDLLE